MKKLVFFCLGLTVRESKALAVLLPRKMNRAVSCVTRETELKSAPDIILISEKTASHGSEYAHALKRFPGVPVISLSKKPKVSPSPDNGSESPSTTINSLVDQIQSALAEKTRPPSHMGQWAGDTERVKQPVFSYFDIEKRLLGVLIQGGRRHRETGKPVKIHMGSLGTCLFLEKSRVLISINHRSLRSLCAAAIDVSRFFIEELTLCEAEGYQTGENQYTDWNKERFLWQVGCWTARGRLPDFIHGQKPLTLRRWPSLTGLPDGLTALAICSLLHHEPVSPEHICQRLNLTAEVVADHICGLVALDGLVQDGKKHMTNKKSAATRAPKKILEKLAGRLLGRWRQSQSYPQESNPYAGQ